MHRAGTVSEEKAPLKWAWRIINDIKSFVVFAKDEEEMQSWLRDIQV
jgi:hypothetical protein